MGKDDMMKFIFIALAFYLIFGQGQPQTQVPPPNGGIPPQTTTPHQCSYAPTVQLYEIDKWDTSKPAPGTFTYKINGGAVTTDTDGSFEVTLNDNLEVLWGSDNKSLYYRDIGTYKITKCGKNEIKSTTGLKSGQNGLIGNSTITVQCFNAEGNLIDDTTENETLAAGESVSLRCEFQTVKAETGTPHGTVVIAELNETLYDKDKFSLTGDILDGTITVPSAYTNRDSASTQIAYKVKPMIDAGTVSFYANIKVDKDYEPGSTGANDITLKLYGIDCFENTDTGKFECALEDQDNSWTKDIQGTETIQVD